MIWKKKLLPLFRIVATPGIGLPHAFDPASTESELMLAGAKPVCIANKDFLTSNFEGALCDKRIFEVGSKTFVSNGRRNTVAVYALKDSIEDGRELFDLYYETDWEGLSVDEQARGVKRIGELLGYTSEDTAFFMEEGIYRNPIVRVMLHLTAQPRRWMRKEVMLMDAPHSNI